MGNVQRTIICPEHQVEVPAIIRGRGVVPPNGPLNPGASKTELVGHCPRDGGHVVTEQA